MLQQIPRIFAPIPSAALASFCPSLSLTGIQKKTVQRVEILRATVACLTCASETLLAWPMATMCKAKAAMVCERYV